LFGFFRDTSGTITVAAVLLTMRLFAEERQSGTIVLLFTSPVSESQIVFGKFVSAVMSMGILVLLTLYMPALIFVHGRVSLGHIAGGYLGLLLVGMATLSLGLLGSALARNQLVAGLLASLFIVILFISWPLSNLVQPPLGTIIGNFSLYEKHFFPFTRGLVQLSDIVYYLSVIYFSLFATIRTLQSQRWQ